MLHLINYITAHLGAISLHAFVLLCICLKVDSSIDKRYMHPSKYDWVCYIGITCIVIMFLSFSAAVLPAIFRLEQLIWR